MKYIIFCSYFLMLAGTTATNASDQLTESVRMEKTGHYLILASFRDTRLLGHFMDRVSPQLDKPIKVTTLQFEERTIYRAMVGPFDKKLTRIQNHYTDLGLSGIWWFSVDAGETIHFASNSMLAKDVEESTIIPFEPVVTTEPVMVEAAPIVVKEPVVVKEPIVVEEPVVAMKQSRKPMSVEYQLEFCATKATARERYELCSDRKIRFRVAKFRKLLAMTDRDYLSYCSRAPGSERPLYCTNRFSDLKADYLSQPQASNFNVRTR